MKPTICRFMLCCACIVIFLPACKKSSGDSEPTPYDGKFSFSYNGTDYTLPFKEGTSEWGIEGNGIYINRPDIFNGEIFFPQNNCAYLQPEGLGRIEMDADCQLTQNGLPIDSVTVFLYSSGSVNITYTNCVYIPQFDPVSGTTVQTKVCDAHGRFELTLKNINDSSIVITNGEIDEYSMVIN